MSESGPFSPRATKFATLPAEYTIDEALILVGNGRFYTQLLYTCGLCLLSFLTQIICVGFILPFIKCDITASMEEQGLLVAAANFGGVFSSHLMGFLGDTWGRSNTLKLALGMSTIFALISGFSINIWMLIITRFFTGFFVSGCQACVFSFCSEFHSSESSAKQVTMISVFTPMSIIFVASAAILILPRPINFNLGNLTITPWRILIITINIAPITAFILVCLIPETPKFELAHGNPAEALKTLQYIFKKNVGKRSSAQYPVHSLMEEEYGRKISDVRNCGDTLKMIWKQTIPIFYRERIWHTLNYCFIVSVAFAIANNVLLWYPTILNIQIQRDNETVCTVSSKIDVSKAALANTNECNGNVETQMFWLLICVGGVSTIIYFIFGCVVEALGKKSILTIWFCVCGLLCQAVPFISNLTFSVIAFSIICAIGNCGGIVGALAVEFYPTIFSAMSVCLIMMIGRLSAAVGSGVFGLMVSKQCYLTYALLSTVLFISALTSRLLPQKIIKKRSTRLIPQV